MMTLKGKNAQDIDIEYIDKRIRDMIKENETLKDVVKKQADKIYRLHNLIDKSDPALIKSWLKSKVKLKHLKMKTSKLKNTSTKIRSANEDIDAMKTSEKSADSRITRLEDSKFSGKWSHEEEKNKNKKPSKFTEDGDIDLITFVSTKILSKFQTIELTDMEQGKTMTEHQYRGKEDIVYDNSTNIDTVIDDNSMSEFSSYEMSKITENHAKTQTQKQSSQEHIEVVMSSEQNTVSLNNFRGAPDK
ncbi:unnamed protein product [Mytilus coruscus]|uniref:Uncharacterized protein n=1 Tax=Mytilus coruscus TaxID=42192 RepID=A0A6J8E8I0_MYTCO|nr:unnamed protein product [Mytilus coruscus]